MDFRHIDAFRAVMLTRTATKAAQLVGTSQPGISRLIAELERSTKLTLFNRERGRLEPTAEAMTFFEEVERRYAGLDNLREFAVRLRNPEASVVRVGCVVSFSLGFFGRAVAAYRHAEPGTQIALSIGPSEAIRNQVVARSLAVAFVTDAGDFAELDAMSFCNVDSLCAIPADHKLAKKRCISLSDLHGEPLIAYEPTTMVRWGIDKLFASHDLSSQVVAVVRYGINVCALVREKVGIGLVHPVNAYDYLNTTGVVFRRIESPVRFHALRIKPRTPAATRQVETLIGVCEATLADVLRDVDAKL
jgi:DNA-binding transcriptional LysR family regulator